MKIISAFVFKYFCGRSRLLIETALIYCTQYSIPVSRVSDKGAVLPNSADEGPLPQILRSPRLAGKQMVPSALLFHKARRSALQLINQI